jgi:hypothetical protein
MATEELRSETVGADQLWHILNMPAFTRHIRRMRIVGSELMQESAFVVYNKPRGYDVSELVVPDVNVVSVDSFLNQFQTGSVDLDKLISADPSDTSSSDDESRLSEKALLKIEKVKASDELSEDDKALIIMKIKEYEWLGTPEQNLRSDIQFSVHNHPYLSAGPLTAVDMLVPSTVDLATDEMILKKNPSYISAIVGSDRKNQAMLLTGIHPRRQPDLVSYERAESRRLGIQNALGALALAGYAATIIDIGKNGKPTPSSHPKIASFTEELRAQRPANR